MQKLWQKKLKLTYSKEVIDIVQFGSSLFESKKPNDIDIAIIFNKIPVKEQLIEIQKIKKQLEIYSDLPIHIISFDLYSFFDENNFAKNDILFYGLSLISQDFFSKRFDLKPSLQIAYSLLKLKKKDKVRLHYALKGKNKKYGLLNKYHGLLISPGLIEVNPLYEETFVTAIKKITPNIKIKRYFENI
ncbi:MAG TPA: hypothetical protein P5277_03875 [Candidatus Paceibacterota bacterium]|nr:hypothetical protein [Candidatus Paceibacterota bacterium]